MFFSFEPHSLQTNKIPANLHFYMGLKYKREQKHAVHVLYGVN